MQERLRRDVAKNYFVEEIQDAVEVATGMENTVQENTSN
jgi:hypothetical protein